MEVSAARLTWPVIGASFKESDLKRLPSEKLVDLWSSMMLPHMQRWIEEMQEWIGAGLAADALKENEGILANASIPFAPDRLVWPVVGAQFLPADLRRWSSEVPVQAWAAKMLPELQLWIEQQQQALGVDVEENTIRMKGQDVTGDSGPAEDEPFSGDEGGLFD